MKQVLFILISLFIFSMAVSAQEGDGMPEVRMQFITHLFSSQDNYRTLHAGFKSGENETYSFYETHEALGARYISIAQSKADTSKWIYYVQYPMETSQDLKDLGEVQPHIFDAFNLYIKSGRLKGDEKTEGEVVRTNLYIAKTEEWFGELVTDNAKRKFYVLLTNARW
jgi:hypothetical protein